MARGCTLHLEFPFPISSFWHLAAPVTPQDATAEHRSSRSWINTHRLCRVWSTKSRLLSQPTLRRLAAQQLQLRFADRPPTTPGGMRQSQTQSPRQALRLHQQQHFQQQQQRLELEAAQQRPWRASANSSAPMLDCPDVLPPDSSEPEWHGQMLTTLGATCPECACRLACG